MTDLSIIEKDGTLWTDSRDVAAMVDKQHKDLMRDIRGYAATMSNSNERNFAPVDFFQESTYSDSKGEARPCYLISKKGCEFVANKLTGNKGVLFTAAYVTKFNAMEQREQPKLSAMQMLRLQSQAMMELDERIGLVEEKVDNQITLDYAQQNTLKEAIGRRVYERAAVIYPPNTIKKRIGRLFPAIYRDLRKRFGAASYKDIRRNDLGAAIKYVEAWIEPADLRTIMEDK